MVYFAGPLGQQNISGLPLEALKDILHADTENDFSSLRVQLNNIFYNKNPGGFSPSIS